MKSFYYTFRFNHLQEGWTVKVYFELTKVEAMHLGSVYGNKHTTQISAASFQDQAVVVGFNYESLSEPELGKHRVCMALHATRVCDRV